MNAGILDRLVTIQFNNVTTDSDTNEEVDNWQNLVIDPQVWAMKMEMVGAEEYQADQLVWDKVVKWVIRYRTDLDAEMRLLDEDGNEFYFIGLREFSGNSKIRVSRREALEISTEIRDFQ